jgi:hypothetical protein
MSQELQNSSSKNMDHSNNALVSVSINVACVISDSLGRDQTYRTNILRGMLQEASSLQARGKTDSFCSITIGH